MIQVGFEFAGHQDVVEENEDAVHVVGEFSDQASFPPGFEVFRHDG